MTDSFVKLPSVLISNENISALELRLLAKLIFWAGVNKKENNHIKYGAEKLGAQIGIGRAACRRALSKLENMRFIKITQRGNLENQSYGLSNDIELRIDDGIRFLTSGGFDKSGGDLNQKDSGHLYLNDSANLNQKRPALYLNDSGVDLNDSGHIDDRDIIKQNLNKISRACAHNETSDAAPVRSMPKPDKSGGNQQGSTGGEYQLDIVDKELAESLKNELGDNLQFITLFKSNGIYGIRPACRVYEKNAAGLSEDCRRAAAKVGRVVQFCDSKTHYQNEIIIDFQKYNIGA